MPHTMLPSAAWMDRLSDRLGALVPGCSRLPPRHPIKVSLLMGLLGYIAGWLVAIYIAMPNFYTPEIGIFLSTGTSFGLLVMLPLLAWGNWSARRALAAPFLLSIAAMINVGSVSHWFVGMANTIADYAIVGIAGGICYALAAISVLRDTTFRSGLTIIIESAVVGMFSHGMAGLGFNQGDWFGWFPRWNRFGPEFIMFGQLFSLFFGGLAIILGQDIWAMPPTSKFEPTAAEPTPGSKS